MKMVPMKLPKRKKNIERSKNVKIRGKKEREIGSEQIRFIVGSDRLDIGVDVEKFRLSTPVFLESVQS